MNIEQSRVTPCPPSEELLDGPRAERVPWDDAAMRQIPNPASAATTTDPAARVEHIELRAVIDQELSTLSTRAADILQRLHGLGEYDKIHTYREAAEPHGITPNGARVITANALRTMRGRTLSSSLKRYVQDSPAVVKQPQSPRCEDVFADIAVPVYDDLDSRPYNVRLQEACELWLAAQPVSTKDLLPPHIYRQIIDSQTPVSLFVHDTRLNTPQDAKQHYTFALGRLRSISKRFSTYLHNRPFERGRTLAHLIDIGVVTHEDALYMFDINISDPEARIAAVNNRMQLTTLDLRSRMFETQKAYTSYRRHLRTSPDRFWNSALPRITKMYDRDKLFAMGLTEAQATCAAELDALQAARRRIINRPLHPGTQASRETSLMVIDTKIKHYTHLAEAGNVHVDGRYLFAILPQEQ